MQILRNFLMFLSALFNNTPAVVPPPAGLDNNQISVVAENLDTPWEIAFLPGGDILVTERPGRLVRIGQDKKIYPVNGVKETSEGGLLGMAVKDPLVYLYLTTVANVNQVVRYELTNDQLINEKVLIDNIPAGPNHDGGRIAFGPDDWLYVTTGETGNERLAQSTKSLAGKILRFKDGVAEMYSYGHRNPQGLAWDDQGNMWSTEHGRSGVQSGFDELNLIKQGANYGWPTIQGDMQKAGMETPIINSGSTNTWAPSGLAFYRGNLYFAGLRGQALYKYNIASKQLTEFFTREYGRLRAVVVGPDGFLYVSTSNRDGRGQPIESDDRILKINTSRL
jgi:glucose/arabinose dehydrogenase